MMKYLILLNVFLMLGSCQAFDDMLYKYENGLKRGIEHTAKGIACVAVGVYPCAVMAGVSGYAEGKQEARLANVAKNNARLVKAMADKQAKDKGVDVEGSNETGTWYLVIAIIISLGIYKLIKKRRKL